MKKTKKTLFSGVGTALVTPFKNGEIDYSTLDRLIEYQIEAGVDAIIVGGTTGEAATLCETERYSLYEHATERVRKRVKVILGTGTNDTRVAINHTKFAERIDADGALIVTPYYNKGTEEGVYLHYATIADACFVPIILYNVPSRTGVNLGFNLLCRLAEHPRIVGLKEAGDSVDRLVKLSELREVLPLYAGNDSQIYPVLSLGGYGVISVTSNILPQLIRNICSLHKAGDFAGALDLQIKAFPFIQSLFTETNPAPIKFIMEHEGMISGEIRLPLAQARESTRETVLKEYRNLINILK